MKVIAQSQPPSKFSYIHLAYLSANLNNQISKGDLISGQAVLGVALATAIVFGAVGAKLAHAGKRGWGVALGGMIGFFAAFALLWSVQAKWEDGRTDEAVVKHVIQTRQYWALRDVSLAASILGAATTNGTAAAMAADYYGQKGRAEQVPELVIRGYRYAELAAAQGEQSEWARVRDLANSSSFEYLRPTFQAALQRGKLSEAEQTWAKERLAQMPEPAAKKEPSAAQP